MKLTSFPSLTATVQRVISDIGRTRREEKTRINVVHLHRMHAPMSQSLLFEIEKSKLNVRDSLRRLDAQASNSGKGKAAVSHEADIISSRLHRDITTLVENLKSGVDYLSDNPRHLELPSRRAAMDLKAFRALQRALDPQALQGSRYKSYGVNQSAGKILDHEQVRDIHNLLCDPQIFYHFELSAQLEYAAMLTQMRTDAKANPNDTTWKSIPRVLTRSGMEENQLIESTGKAWKDFAAHMPAQNVPAAETPRREDVKLQIMLDGVVHSLLARKLPQEAIKHDYAESVSTHQAAGGRRAMQANDKRAEHLITGMLPTHGRAAMMFKDKPLHPNQDTANWKDYMVNTGTADAVIGAMQHSGRDFSRSSFNVLFHTFCDSYGTNVDFEYDSDEPRGQEKTREQREQPGNNSRYSSSSSSSSSSSEAGRPNDYNDDDSDSDSSSINNGGYKPGSSSSSSSSDAGIPDDNDDDDDDSDFAYISDEDLARSYDILGVNPTDSFDVITKQYRKLALKNHPDKALQKGFNETQGTDQFQKINEAYETVSKHRAT